MVMNKIILSIVCGLFVLNAFSQTGKISGSVVDLKSGEELLGATVLIEGTSKGASVSVETGKYLLENIAPGKYNLICQYVSYQAKKIIDVEVKAGQTTEVNIALDGGLNLDSIVVVGEKISNNEVAIIEEIKEADGVVSGMSGATIQKGSDRDGAEVARRIPGVTVVDNRFVMVRGLSERYNSVLLNNALTPSVETDVKSFSFDLIPSQMIDKFLIYKSPSADLPGEFAGGAIKIYTKNIPDKDLLSVGYSSGFRNGTSLQPFSKAEGSKTDWLGFDNKLRVLPSAFPENVRDITDDDQLTEVGKSLNNNWKYSNIQAPIDHRLNIQFGKRIEKEKFILGTITSLNYSNTYLTQINNQNDYNIYDTLLQESDTVFSYYDTLSRNQSRIGVLHNWGLKYKGNIIEFKNTFNQTGTNELTIRGGTNFEEGSDRLDYSYRNNQRTIYTGQLNGTHKIKEDISEIDWTLGYSLSRRKDPDWKRARYTRPLDTEDPYAAYVSTTANPFFLGRIFLDLNEDIMMAASNYEHTFAKKEDMYDESGKLKKYLPKIKAGFYAEKKERQFSVRNIGYAPSNIFGFDWNLIYKPIDSLLMDENINSGNGFKIDEDTKPSDSYVASNRIISAYVMGSLPITKKLYAVGGVRIENNVQSLFSNEANGDTVIVDNPITSILPSLNVSYNFSDTCLIRFAYGRTVNRPEFRELAPLYFYDFVFNSILSGNDSLKTPSIDNFDLRYEVYPNPTEFLSLGLFYKKFTNPIESYFAPGVGSGGTRSFVPGNAPSAISMGVELDVRKSLRNFTKIKFINDFSVVANASFIKSRIILADEELNTGVSNERPLMGQSPYIINGGLYYQNDSIDLSVTALYNIIGPRIAIVGIPGVPEVWEMPRNTVDLTITKGIGKYVDLRFSIQDLFNQSFVLLQDANDDGILNKETDQTMQSYKRGTYFTFGITVNL
jgi:outer membrane receptor for ferrienterochelin and colicin